MASRVLVPSASSVHGRDRSGTHDYLHRNTQLVGLGNAIFGSLVRDWIDCGLALAGPTMKETLKAGVLYFDLVFAAGFLLGTVRTLRAVPRLGVRTAELMEVPIMPGVSILAARCVVRHVATPPLRARRLAMGGVALGLMLLAEFT